MVWSPSIARDYEAWVLAWVVSFRLSTHWILWDRSFLSWLHFLSSVDSFNEELKVLVSTGQNWSELVSTGSIFHSNKQSSLSLTHSSFLVLWFLNSSMSSSS